MERVPAVNNPVFSNQFVATTILFSIEIRQIRQNNITMSQVITSLHREIIARLCTESKKKKCCSGYRYVSNRKPFDHEYIAMIEGKKTHQRFEVA